MDNLTHSLVGALIGQMGLKRKTGLAMPTLIIAANLPDIDAVATLLGGHQHLAIRRGITHGPIAMLLLPLLLWGAMLAYAKWRPNPDRLPVDKGWLLALAYIGCLSHPLFDWFNSYGIRLLEPFSSRWFYGDTIFIIDIWIWAVLIIGIWWSVRSERTNRARWTRPARLSAFFLLLYIPTNFAISGIAKRTIEFAYNWERDAKPTMVVANPVPFAFWRREVLWRDSESFGHADFNLFDARNYIGHSEGKIVGSGLLGPDEAELEKGFKLTADARAFLFWSRMPVTTAELGSATLSDQRFTNQLVADRFTVKVEEK